MQVAFFVTPIMWQASELSGHPAALYLIQLNPFDYILNVVRNPLLGIPLSSSDILGAISISVGLIVVSLVGFARFRGRIAFWV